MRVFADVAEAAERLDELIDLAARDDEVFICRDGHPVAALTAHPARKEGRMDDLWTLMAAGRPVKGKLTSNHDDFYDENGLPR